jgi:hypothetical protein
MLFGRKKPKNGQYKRGKCGKREERVEVTSKWNVGKAKRTQAREKGNKTYVDSVSM